MSVPSLDLRSQYQTLRQQLMSALERVMESQHFILGAEVEALEREIATYCGSKHAVGCASGSDALLLALMALGVAPGSEVVTTPFSFFATAGSIVRLGARPTFVDIDRRTYNIDVSQVESSVGPRTSAILPVHLYGQCSDMGPLLEIAEKQNIPIIEDAAQAIGATYLGRLAGSMGAIGCFSFYPTKNLGGAGDGGMLTTDDAQLADQLRVLRNHGGKTDYEHFQVGLNSRLDALQAAVLRVKLNYVESWSEARRQKAKRYTELFEDAGLTERVQPPFVENSNQHIFHQYVVRVPQQRDRLKEHLAKNGVVARIYYPTPLHLQPCFNSLGYGKGDFPEAERAAQETLALPLYPELSEAQQVYVVKTIQSFMLQQ